MTGPLRIRFSDPVKAAEVVRMQDNLAGVLDVLASTPVLGGSQIVGVEFTASALTVNIEHGLGRKWTNWAVTDRNADESIWRSASANPERYLTLTASGEVTVNLLVW